MDARIANLIVERDEARLVAEWLLKERESLLAQLIEKEKELISLRALLGAAKWGAECTAPAKT